MIFSLVNFQQIVQDHKSKISFVLPDLFSYPLQNGHLLFWMNSNSYSSSRKNFPHWLQHFKRTSGAILMKYLILDEGFILRESKTYKLYESTSFICSSCKVNGMYYVCNCCVSNVSLITDFIAPLSSSFLLKINYFDHLSNSKLVGFGQSIDSSCLYLSFGVLMFFQNSRVIKLLYERYSELVWIRLKAKLRNSWMKWWKDACSWSMHFCQKSKDLPSNIEDMWVKLCPYHWKVSIWSSMHQVKFLIATLE